MSWGGERLARELAQDVIREPGRVELREGDSATGKGRHFCSTAGRDLGVQSVRAARQRSS